MIEPGRCEICRSRPARLVLLRRRLGVEKRTYVCRECSRERGKIYSGTIVALYDGVRKQGMASAFGLPSSVCEFCGTRITDEEETKPGCAACYECFGDVIEQRIKAVQGLIRHVGKSPVT